MPLSKTYTDPSCIKGYLDYQSRYVKEDRESDLKFMELLSPLLCFGNPKVLDVGCNQGNFLRMIRRKFPFAELHGVDIVPTFVSEAIKLTKTEENISYSVADIRTYHSDDKFDVIIANASLMYLNDAELISTMAAVSNNLVPRGTFIAFDYFHPFVQNLAIREFDLADEELHLRSYDLMNNFCMASRFELPEFKPFEVSKTLPYQKDTIKTYTRRFEDGENASFRGIFYQPWCFMVARKK